MIEGDKPRQLIEAYLGAMQASDAAAVQSMSAADALLEYPGATRFESPAALFRWAKERHRWVRHEIEHCDMLGTEADGVIYVTGTLAGELAGGLEFSEVRFAYRFRIRAGLISETRLWSDIADLLRRKALEAHGTA
ncbi:MAG: nuclear transport factor 2 family protein [Parvibaculaceae bacterium]